MGLGWFGLLVIIVLGWALYTGALDVFGALFWGFILLIGLPFIIIGIIIFFVIVLAVIFE